MIDSGVRSSCDASAVKRTCCSNAASSRANSVSMMTPSLFSSPVTSAEGGDLLLLLLLLAIDQVPLSSAGGDESLAQLLADVRYMHLDQVGQSVGPAAVAAGVVAEQVVVDRRPGDHLAAVQGEQLDQGVLARRQ